MGGIEMSKKEDNQKPKEDSKNTNSIKDRIKNLTGGESSKKDEKEIPKIEQTKKPNNFSDKYKIFIDTEQDCKNLKEKDRKKKDCKSKKRKNKKKKDYRE